MTPVTSRYFVLLLSLILALAGATRLSAHDPLRFDGTVVKMDVAKGVLTMRTIDNGQDVNLDITFGAGTAVTQNAKKVARSALKPGMHVIVDALGCVDDPRIDGVEVQIIPGRAQAAPRIAPSSPAPELGMEIPSGDRVPTITLHDDGPRPGEWAFSITTDLIFTEILRPYQPMHGHVHVYVDGKATLMISKKAFTVSGLAPGKHTVRVVLAGTDHRTLLHGGVPIADSLDIMIPATGSGR